MLQEHLACPFSTHVLGEPVHVERIDLQRHRRLIPILSLPPPSPPPLGWEWIAAYRYWARGGR